MAYYAPQLGINADKSATLRDGERKAGAQICAPAQAYEKIAAAAERLSRALATTLGAPRRSPEHVARCAPILVEAVSIERLGADGAVANTDPDRIDVAHERSVFVAGAGVASYLPAVVANEANHE